MGRQYELIDEAIAGWVAKQPLFFVATAPTSTDGLVNLSPKGSKETFRILGPTTVAYLDLIGSGIETVAHLKENGRIVVMFCAFDGPPKIFRFHGQGRVVEPGHPEFEELLANFSPSRDHLAVLRSIIVVEVSRIGDSCGFVVPRMDFVEERQQLFNWAENKQETLGDGWDTKYRQANNASSIDGLPGLDFPDSLTDGELDRLSSAGRAL